jgi:diketogulonate reductase-like aldo/keto reductase
MATIAMAWCLMRGANPIVRLGSKERIDEAVAAVSFASASRLGEEDLKYLEAYQPKVRVFPNSLMGN